MILKHYGTPKHSGRYPWGSGENPYHHGADSPGGRGETISRRRLVSASKTREKIDQIIESLSSDDKDKILAGSDHYLNVEEGSHVVKRFLSTYGDLPVGFFDLLEDGEEDIQVCLGTRSGSEYRGKGIGSDLTEQAVKYIKRNKNRLPQKRVVWGVRVDNIPSIKIAQKNGFVLDPTSYSDDKTWVNYVLEI